MNKKGIELPQNVIVIAIIVLIVLVVIIALFAGGTGTIFSRFQDLFSKSVDDESTAISFCQQYCEQDRNKPTNLQKNSKYCTETFTLDRFNNDNPSVSGSDGKADKDKATGRYVEYACSNNNAKGISYVVGVECGEITCI